MYTQIQNGQIPLTKKKTASIVSERVIFFIENLRMLHST